MTKAQKVILFFAIIAYAGVLVSFLTDHHILILIFVIASAVLLISFNLAGGAEIDLLEAEKNEEIEKIRNELVQAKRDETLAKEQLSDKDNALNETLKLYRDAQTEMKEAKDNLDKAIEETERIKQEASERQEAAVNAAVEEALARTRISVDDKSFAGYEALIPHVSDDEQVEDLNLVTLAKETADELKAYADKASIDLKVNAVADKIIFKGDELRLKIMLRNIIDNAIKYMGKPGSLVITLSTVGDEIFIVCKDDGNGLSASETEHVFELNFQGSNRISGNGLGLTQSKAIADRYNGSIYAKSTEGRGMGIYIQLPLGEANTEETKAAKTDEAKADEVIAVDVAEAVIVAEEAAKAEENEEIEAAKAEDKEVGADD